MCVLCVKPDSASTIAIYIYIKTCLSTVQLSSHTAETCDSTTAALSCIGAKRSLKYEAIARGDKKSLSTFGAVVIGVWATYKQNT